MKLAAGVVLVSFGGAAACGGRSEVGLDDEAAEAVVYRPFAGATTPLWVPGGTAWIGYFTFDVASRTTAPAPCPPYALRLGIAPAAVPITMPTAPYFVDGFYLDQDEATVGAYDKCVAGGGCRARQPSDSPTADDLPVGVDREQAAQYCAWRGGTLPSWIQLRRAEMGDLEPSAAIPSRFLGPAFDCWANPSSGDGCDEFRAQSQPSRPIRSNPDDVGPYGHYDLFGSQWEITTTKEYPVVWDPRITLACAEAGGPAPPFDDAGSDNHWLYAPNLSFQAFIAVEPLLTVVIEPLNPNQAMWGVRCVFPSREETGQ